MLVSLFNCCFLRRPVPVVLVDVMATSAILPISIQHSITNKHGTQNFSNSSGHKERNTKYWSIFEKVRGVSLAPEGGGFGLYSAAILACVQWPLTLCSRYLFQRFMQRSYMFCCNTWVYITPSMSQSKRHTSLLLLSFLNSAYPEQGIWLLSLWWRSYLWAATKLSSTLLSSWHFAQLCSHLCWASLFDWVPASPPSTFSI